MFQPTQGSLILGRYLIEHELERGGMSSVWVAADLKLQRSVAVKLLKRSLGESHDARARFEREAMAVAQLQSPHVVQIFDYGVEHDSPIIVMERLYGEDLRARMKREHRLTLSAVAKVLFETAKGLSEAHAAGIVHRDLKPGNIFFARSRQDEVVKLLDFGVAKAMEGSAIAASPSSGGLVGTPHFMSPEQARGSDDIDHRSDLWSLGVIVYNALTGRLPYGGTSTPDVLAKICTQRFAAPSIVCPDLPPEIDAFMMRALARDSVDRFASAREMTAAFSRIVPVSAPALDMPAPFDFDDDETTVYDTSRDMADTVGLPGPPPLPREFAPMPSDLPSQPSHPSTLGSAMLDGPMGLSPTRRLVVWSLALLLVGGIAVAGAIAAWSPSDEAPVTVETPTVAPPAPAAAGETDAEDESEAVPPAQKPIARSPKPTEAPAPRAQPTPKPVAQAGPKPVPKSKPAPQPKAKDTPPPSEGAKEPDWYRSRF